MYNHKPDFEHLSRVLRLETADGPIPLMELPVDPEIMSEATGIAFPAGKATGLFYDTSAIDNGPAVPCLGMKLMDLNVEFHGIMGYDYVWTLPAVPIRTAQSNLIDTHEEGRKKSAPGRTSTGVLNSGAS